MFRFILVIVFVSTFSTENFRQVLGFSSPWNINHSATFSGLQTDQYFGYEPFPDQSSKQAVSSPERPAPSPSPSYVIRRSRPGFIRSTSVGTAVTIGVTASIRFSIIVNGILATDLNSSDDQFRERVPSRSLPEFRSLKRNYVGGLNVPFLEIVGANLNETVTIVDLVLTSRTLFMYRRLTFFARRILTRQPVTKIRISGTTSVTGTSFIPTTIFSFIKVATVELIDGSEVQVISADPNDVTFASFDGTGIISNVTAVQDFRVETLS